MQNDFDAERQTLATKWAKACDELRAQRSATSALGSLVASDLASIADMLAQGIADGGLDPESLAMMRAVVCRCGAAGDAISIGSGGSAVRGRIEEWLLDESESAAYGSLHAQA